MNIITAQKNVQLYNKTKEFFTISIYEFTIMKACKVDIHPARAHIITLLKLILLKKCYGILRFKHDDQSKYVVSGIFRNANGICARCLAKNIRPGNVLFAELIVWLETDSQLVLLAFKSIFVVFCNVRNRWQNCLLLIRNMR